MAVTWSENPHILDDPRIQYGKDGEKSYKKSPCLGLFAVPQPGK